MKRILAALSMFVSSISLASDGAKTEIQNGEEFAKQLQEAIEESCSGINDWETYDRCVKVVEFNFSVTPHNKTSGGGGNTCPQCLEF